MSPWSRAEAVREEEAFERELFAGRERAMGPVAGVPSLEAVLRAADATREARVERAARGRSLVAMMLAAACFMAALTKLPDVETRSGSIAPDMDAGAPGAAMFFEQTAAETCTVGDVAMTTAQAEARACFQPPPMFSPAPPESFAPAATFTPAPSAPTCEDDVPGSPLIYR